MCLAIFKPKGVQIKRDYLQHGYEGNPHGCGFAFVHNKAIEIFKGYQSFGDFYSDYKVIERKHKMLIHFRWRTHGEKSVANTHPIYLMEKSFAMVHNGIINIKTEGDESDTVAFGERVISPLVDKFGFKASLTRYLIETSIGSGNKIVLLNAENKHAIFNESSGHWHKGAWYSNRGYESSTTRVYSNWSPSTVSYVTQADADELEAEIDACKASACDGVADAESSNKVFGSAHPIQDTKQTKFPDWEPNPHWKAQYPKAYWDRLTTGGKQKDNGK